MQIFVTVGTDHHRFDRLIDAVDRWLISAEIDCSVLVQHGHSRPSAVGNNTMMMRREELDRAYAEADLIIAQAGPGTISDAHAVGKKPLVVARLADQGEVVDDHQVSYAEFMASRDLVALARTAADFVALANRMVADPEMRTVGSIDDLAAERDLAASHAASAVAGTTAGHRGRRNTSWRHLARRAVQMARVRAPHGLGSSGAWNGEDEPPRTD